VECRAPSLKSRQYNTGRFPAPAICTRARKTSVLALRRRRRGDARLWELSAPSAWLTIVSALGRPLASRMITSLQLSPGPRKHDISWRTYYPTNRAYEGRGSDPDGTHGISESGPHNNQHVDRLLRHPSWCWFGRSISCDGFDWKVWLYFWCCSRSGAFVWPRLSGPSCADDHSIYCLSYRDSESNGFLASDRLVSRFSAASLPLFSALRPGDSEKLKRLADRAKT
jgi:hypothetical protein